MPELPEVETVKRYLKEHILNKRIVKVDILYEKIIQNETSYFKNSLINDEFINILRKGKYLIFETNNNYLISHLRMEGKFNFYKNNYNLGKHDHIIINFEDSFLVYNDVRKFGRMEIIDKNDLNEYFSKLGLEPQELTYNYLKNKLNKNIDIKSLLLNQSIILGLGNIYANEILFFSKINPFKTGKDLTKDEIERIIKYSQIVINDAIDKKGTTIKSFTSALDIKGEYQKFLKVHMKKQCSVCDNEIIKVKIKGRSSYYCKICQK